MDHMLKIIEHPLNLTKSMLRRKGYGQPRDDFSR